MTVSSATIKNIYAGTGARTTWPYTFQINAAEDVSLYLEEDGVVTEVTSNFSVDTETQLVTYPLDGDPVSADVTVAVIRETERTQEVDLINGGPYDADVIEGALDKLTRIMLEIREELDRAVILNLTLNPTAEERSATELLADIAAYSASAAASASASAVSAAASGVSNTAAGVSAGEAAASAAAAAASAALVGDALGTSGLLADRPANGGAVRTYFYAQDQDQEYMWSPLAQRWFVTG